jgi:hypothetical protein
MSAVLTTPSDRIGRRLEAWLLVEEDDERLLERVERFLGGRAQ